MSLKHFRLLAKQLLKGIEAGDAQAAERVARHLPRLSGRPPEQVRAAGVGLQEAQHVIAREHGYRQWADLPGGSEVAFEDLRHLSDADISALLRRQKRRDLTNVLKLLEAGCTDACREVCEAFLRLAGSENARQRLLDDGQLFAASPEDIERSQQRLVEEAHRDDAQAHHAAWHAMVRELEQAMASSLAAARLRYALITEGLTALAAGKRGPELDAELDAAQEGSADPVVNP